VKQELGAGGVGRIAVIGDSLSVKDGAWVTPYRNALQALHGASGAGYYGFGTRNGVVLPAQWAGGVSDDDIAPFRGLDGLWSTAATGPSAFFSLPSQAVELHFTREPGAGMFRIRRGIDYAILATIDCADAATSLGTWTYPVPTGDHSLRIEPIGAAPVTILGYDNQSSASGVRVHRMANGGYGVDNFLQRDWTFDAQLAHLDPDLVYIWLGQNDQGMNFSQFFTQMNLLVDRVQAAAPDAGIVLVGTYNQGSSYLIPVVQATRAVAEQRGLGFIDMYEAAGYPEYFLDNYYLADTVHFNTAGSQYISSIMVDAFETDGASLVTSIMKHPRSTLYPLGETATFSLEVSRTLETISIQWRKDGQPLTEGGAFSGTQTPDLVIAADSIELEGRYDAIVTTSWGVETTRFATLRLQAIPLCAGDANGDGVSNFDDITSVLTNWGRDYSRTTFLIGPGDADLDAFVDFDDMTQVIVSWGQACP
jgi:lysophospholipase L1-like esterase